MTISGRLWSMIKLVFRYIFRPYVLLDEFLGNTLNEYVVDPMDSILGNLIAIVVWLLVMGIAVAIPIVCLVKLINIIKGNSEAREKEALRAGAHAAAPRYAAAIKGCLPAGALIRIIRFWPTMLTVGYEMKAGPYKPIDVAHDVDLLGNDYPLSKDQKKYAKTHNGQVAVCQYYLETLAHELIQQYPLPGYHVDIQHHSYTRETGEYRVESRIEQVDRQSVTRIEKVTPVKEYNSYTSCEILPDKGAPLVG